MHTHPYISTLFKNKKKKKKTSYLLCSQTPILTCWRLQFFATARELQKKAGTQQPHQPAQVPGVLRLCVFMVGVVIYEWSIYQTHCQVEVADRQVNSSSSGFRKFLWLAVRSKFYMAGRFRLDPWDDNDNCTALKTTGGSRCQAGKWHYRRSKKHDLFPVCVCVASS